MDWLQHERRKREQEQQQRDYQGEERRKQYSHGELPPNPTPGDPGVDARNQQWLERERAAERDRTR